MAKPWPGPFLWLWYTFGGRLPDRYREWVLHDCTTSTWLWRYAARITVKSLPFLIGGYLVSQLLPVPDLPILAALGLGLLLALFFTLTSAEEFREVRLAQHGFSAGIGTHFANRRHMGRRHR
ncbi:hypothetical protein DMH04_28715 [Kibdelosporangium aridum]|uniref:DUF5313 domain-containing protein n=1 Tax=Kibdelosporangium aridum TaxID=2030 RepID=A0A428Z3X1_KIBAR|nr:DUF5313 family protein [Kibdelosporangium aridum]RSM80898.1 hypothetical protein DMH04_28715 [Kibdelosporangium aridum]